MLVQRAKVHVKVGFHELLTFCVPTAWHSIIVLYLFNVDELKSQSNIKQNEIA